MWYYERFIYFILLFLVSDGFIEVYVSAVETPSQFWVQIVGPGITALDKLVSDMNTYYSNKENYEMHKLKSVNIWFNNLISISMKKYLKDFFTLLFYLFR